MSNQKSIIALIKALSGQANILTIPRVYIGIVEGDIEAALLLSQCVYWSDKTSNPDGWFYKSYRDWDDELGLSQFKVSRCATLLKALNVLETKIKRANNAPTVHYRVSMDTLTDSIIKFLDNQETRLSGNSIMDNEVSQQSDYQETSQSLTETTTETISYAGAIKRTPEQLRQRTLEAMARGINKDLSIKEMVERTFGISPNWDTKTARAFMQWAKSIPHTQDFQTFSAWWYEHDWRGQKRQPPTLPLIQELWPQAFNGSKSTTTAALGLRGPEA